MQKLSARALYWFAIKSAEFTTLFSATPGIMMNGCPDRFPKRKYLMERSPVLIVSIFIFSLFLSEANACFYLIIA